MEKYSLQTVIGEGTFGRALLVQCQNTQEKYVLKEIQLPKNPSKSGNSWREAVLLSKMKHPNIVAFREAFEADDLLCIVMEYCGGGDLLQRIRQQKTTHFGVDDILRWFGQMCAGTKHIHDKQVLHRDLKSKNIFLTHDGTIKLGDFGSACVLNSSEAFAQTYVGTPYYVAPEIWENKPYNNKSDVWSLGCVLYELCALRHPFQAPSWKSLILKVCRGAYPPLPGHLPYELRHLIKQMFKTCPRDRPSLRTILTSHRASRLLRPHLSRQAIETEGRGRATAAAGDGGEGKEVVNLPGKESGMETTTFEGAVGPRPRKQWSVDAGDSALRELADATLASSDGSAPSGGFGGGSTPAGVCEVSENVPSRRRWEVNPPEKLLSLLERATLSRSFRTYLIRRGGDDPLAGPLAQRGDDTDGPEQDVTTQEERLQPRSDDEDTDFEEESPCDWMDGVEKMFLQR